MNSDEITGRKRVPRADIILLGIACIAALLAVVLAYSHNFVFICRDALPTPICAGLSGAPPRLLSIAGLLGVAAMIRPAIFADVIAALRPTLDRVGGLMMLGGLALIFAPWFINNAVAGVPPALLYLVLWLSGLAIFSIGTVTTLFSLPALSSVLQPVAAPFCALVALGLALPELALALQPIWRNEWLTDATFQTVIGILTLLGQTVVSDAQTKMIGITDFRVLVGAQCSGVEGFALISLFTASYVVLFRKQLHLGRALLLFPIGIIASWCLNSVRITALLMIGRHISPELAVEGFHSHAGWLMFMLLSVSLAVAAHQVRWLRRDDTLEIAAPAPTRPSFITDPMTVMILPFAVFMASSTVASALSATPALLYPWRMMAVVTVLAMGWTVLRALPWRIDTLSAASGVICGVLWVATAPAAAAPDAMLADRLAGLSAPILAIWVIARVTGTALVVPIVEELFFRGYILKKLDLGGMTWRIIALAVSTAAFAFLHDRYIAAALAGILFGLVYLRRGNITDAIISHALANAVIAGWALTQGDFSVI